MLLQGDRVMGELSRALSASSLRQKVIAHNLANLNTPGFKRYRVDFEKQLSRAQGQAISLKRSRGRHLGAGSKEAAPAVRVDSAAIRRVDGNNVDLETEMLDLVTNQLRYNTYVQQINNRFSMWRYVINEGRR
ncbi:MAG TPA: flagellar basal body rod protein FlgB [Firmicutes bacterium]|nr:flagellar basal body rod protein FlgB [Bacillota bacterium]